MIEAPDRFSEAWDLDQILVDDYERPWSLQAATRVFHDVVVMCRPVEVKLVTSLMIHLAQSPHLELEPPVARSVQDLEADEDHPPSIIVQKLVHPEPNPVEMYRLPLPPLADTHLHNHSIQTSYLCWRSTQAQELSESYDRDWVLSSRN